MTSEAESLIDEIIEAARSFEYSQRYHGKERVEADGISLEDAKAALVALLARDDARIARLEDVVQKARAVNGYATISPSESSYYVLRRVVNALQDALAALDDADAPGGG